LRELIKKHEAERGEISEEELVAVRAELSPTVDTASVAEDGLR
jgi:hypothetical protein